MVASHEVLLCVAWACTTGYRRRHKVASLGDLNALDVRWLYWHGVRIGTRTEADARHAKTLIVDLPLAGRSVALRLLWAIVVRLLAGLDPLLGAVGVRVLVVLLGILAHDARRVVQLVGLRHAVSSRKELTSSTTIVAFRGPAGR